MRSQLDAAVRRDERFLDLQIDWVRYKSGTPIARFGGVWDRTEKAFAGDAQRSRVIEVHGAQAEAIGLFDRWMADHLRGPDPEVLARVREVIQQDLAFDAELGALLGLSELFLKPELGRLVQAVAAGAAVELAGAPCAMSYGSSGGLPMGGGDLDQLANSPGSTTIEPVPARVQR